jgi:DNA (cytosine-5)-methyltransferase 1
MRYELSVFRLNAADYGVPQSRDRVFIIGNREGKKLNSIPPICSVDAEGKVSRPPHRTVTDAFRGLPPLGEKLQNHTSRDHSERIIERYTNLKYGERDSKTRINKLDPKRPSYTIIVGSDKGGGKGHVHPFEPREVSPRESARIQTFPDWWAFSGTSRHPIRQVGNAVPPVMAAMIGRELMKHFFGGEKRSLKTILSLLGQEHLFKENIDAL